MHLLTHIDEISPTWISAALAQSGTVSADITDVAHTPIGNGNSSETYQLALKYAGQAAGLPETLILKIHSENPETAERAGAAGVYRCEHQMAGLLMSLPNLQVPQFYHSAVSDDGHQANIVMQDLSGLCDAGDQIVGTTPAQIMATISELVKLHKRFWNAPELDELPWTMDRMPMHREGAAMIKQRLADRLSSEQIAIIDDSLPYIDAWLARVPKDRTLIHADCRADNILFDNSEPAHPKAYLIDWALASVGDPMADIAYLISSSVKTEERAACEKQAISYYVGEISQAFPEYTEELAIEAYRQNITASMSLTFLAGFSPQTPHTDLLLETLIRRNCATLKDWLFS